VGTRHFYPDSECPRCGEKDEWYYAPTCGFLHHHCPCGAIIDLETFQCVSEEEERLKLEEEGYVELVEGEEEPSSGN